MNSITSACVLVCVFAALQEGVTARKPSIIPAVEDLLIEEGDELRLECQGEGRFRFSTQTITGDNEPSDLTDSFNEAIGTYTFIVPNATIKNTGWYACAEEGVEIRNDEQTIEHPSENISWIYVYVNSSEPFAVKDASFETVRIIAGSDGVIPCRPTSPELPVILEIRGGDIPVPEDTTYDPRIGFVLKKVGKERNWEHYTCKLNGTDDENGTKPWPIYSAVVAGNEPLPRPTIMKDRLHHVVSGEDLTLECRITVQEGIRFRLYWIVPSSIPKERLYSDENQIYFEGFTSRQAWKRELTIKNVEESDGGEYICVARSLNGEKTQSSIELRIWDQAQSSSSNSLISSSSEEPREMSHGNEYDDRDTSLIFRRIFF